MSHYPEFRHSRTAIKDAASAIRSAITGSIIQDTPAGISASADFWTWVRDQYVLDASLINLNNAGTGPQPKSVQEAHIDYCRYCNRGPSYFMWRELDKSREPLRKRLADMAGVRADEVAINRNATEGLSSVAFGLDLKAGDEVALARQDYPNVINAWKQRERRDGIRLAWVDLCLPSEDNAGLAEAYIQRFTDRTRVVNVTHMIHWTGQILPVRRIADEAHRRDIEVICDGAHTFGHIDYRIPDLGCDYWATSLHKWLSAPFGSGMLRIRNDKISKVWPLLSSEAPEGANIRKCESLGTRSFASEMAINAAIDFHENIGSKRKEARLRFPRDYWVDQVRELPGVVLHTPPGAPFSCAIAAISVAGHKPGEIETRFMRRHRIHCAAIKCGDIEAIRISPNLYTSLEELDKLVAGIRELAGNQASSRAIEQDGLLMLI